LAEAAQGFYCCSRQLKFQKKVKKESSSNKATTTVATNRLNRPLLNIRLHFSAKDLARLKFSQQPQNKKAVDSGRNLISKTYHFIVHVFTHTFNSPSKSST